MTDSERKVQTLLRWLMDKGYSNKHVDLECQTCGEKNRIPVMAAFSVWSFKHRGHEVSMKNPFKKTVGVL